MSQPRLLMCPPEHFDVEYVINPWMEGQVHATNRSLAEHQWSRLHSLLCEQANIVCVPAVAGLPDLVFTANAGLIYRGEAVLSSFRFPEQQPESIPYGEWLTADGFEVHTLPPAFDEASNLAIESHIPPHQRIAVSEEDATGFACNAVNIGNRVILNHASAELTARLNRCGFEVTSTPLSEFIRAGGAAKCLSLRLNEV